MIDRKIIHIDMDAFYASVEQRDNPSLKGKPVAVGGGERRGVTTTASYEARKFGVRSAMPGYMAKKLCPELIFVPPRFEAYSAVSKQIRSIFKTYTDLIEPLSLDEAFLDVTENKKGFDNATDLARDIIHQVKEETALTCSAGVSYCKFLAKVASGLNKPNAITIIRPKEAKAFLKQLPIEDFFGVGKVTARKMNHLGIFNGTDLLEWSKLDLATSFGKSGAFYYDIVRGKDDRPINADQIRKSLAVERTLNENLSEPDQIMVQLDGLMDVFFNRLTKAQNFGRTITLKLKTGDFETITRSYSAQSFIINKSEIQKIASKLMLENMDAFSDLRLMGLTASNLQSEWLASHQQQLSLDL